MDEAGIARYVKEQNIGLVGIGAMTRMIAKAYRMADAIRAAGVPVVMGGPHVTEMPDRSAWPRRRNTPRGRCGLGRSRPDVAENRGRRGARNAQGRICPSGCFRSGTKTHAAALPDNSLEYDKPRSIQSCSESRLSLAQESWDRLGNVSRYSGRIGARMPYGCEFCTVTGFFGDSIRFRTNESVVNELLLLKERAASEGGKIAVFFIDDNFAINVKRTKSLLRDIIAANAQVHWIAQISANLLRDEELVDLIAPPEVHGFSSAWNPSIPQSCQRE